jgi:hypothetical protein
LSSAAKGPDFQCAGPAAGVHALRADRTPGGARRAGSDTSREAGRCTRRTDWSWPPLTSRLRDLPPARPRDTPRRRSQPSLLRVPRPAEPRPGAPATQAPGPTPSSRPPTFLSQHPSTHTWRSPALRLRRDVAVRGAGRGGTPASGVPPETAWVRSLRSGKETVLFCSPTATLELGPVSTRFRTSPRRTSQSDFRILQPFPS